MRKRIYGTGLAGLVLSMAACQPPQQVEVDPPMPVDMAPEPAARAQPRTIAVEIDIERAFPITADDVGDLMVASGTVVGIPARNGFFLRTEGNRVVFVQSMVPVAPGQQARVVGPLQAADVAVFDGWVRTVLGTVAPDWDLLRLYYIRATAVAVEVDLETALPITPEDVGDVMFASGTVVGTPGPAGFFLRTERNRVVFVESPVRVAVGQRVRAVGPLQAVEMPVFDGWERGLLGNVRADWDLLRLYYIDASAVAVEVELERTLPITSEDIGDLMLVTGTVVGNPGPAGFFVRTEGNRVVFVESAVPATIGQRVRIVGPLRAATVAAFDGWERGILGQVQPEWDLLRLYYVHAESVAVVR